MIFRRVRGSAARERISLPVLVLLAALVLIIGYPLLLLAAMALNVGDAQALLPTHWGLANFVRLLGHLEWIRNTLLVALAGSTFGTALALLLAWIIYRTTIPGRRVLELLVTIPYPMGPLVGALAWSELASPHGGLINVLFDALTGSHASLVNIYSVPGIVFVMAIFEAPVAFLMIGAAMGQMDPSLEECSAVMGAGRLMTALRITIPLMLPAILSAWLFLFISMMGAFAIPTILGTNSRFYVATTAIYTLFQGYPPQYPLAAAVGFVLIAFAAIAVWLYTRALRGRSYAVVGGRTYRPRPIDMKGLTPFLFAVVCAYVVVALALPLGILLVASLQRNSNITLSAASWTLHNYRYVLFDFPTTRQAIVNSLLLGIGTGTVGTALATILAWVIYRSRGAGRGVLEQLTMVPQSLPRLIFAAALLWMMLALPLKLYGTLFAVLIAYIIVFLPLAYRSITGVVVQLDRSLEEAGRVHGAGWLSVMRSITVPLLSPGLLAAWVLLFMVSVREVSASIFLAGPGAQVLGPAIFNFWDSGGLPQVSALVIVQTAIILVALIVIRSVHKKGVAI
ncbi:MAG: iron ABC transporter permease [Rhizobiaceae bacterium]|nr:MAG: iron ABC transporter permease [Rhizobiaceae bacterium]